MKSGHQEGSGKLRLPLGFGRQPSHTMGMRVLLMDMQTGMYFVQPGKWTADPAEAHPFPSGDRVIDMALQEKITNGAMFYHFQDAAQNFSVPIPKGLK